MPCEGCDSTDCYLCFAAALKRYDGWIFVIQGWITEFRYKNKEAAKKSYLLSYLFNIPAYILGVLGWNWKEAMSNQVQD